MSEQGTPSEGAIPVQAAATATATAEPVLELDGLTSGYNGSAVLRDVGLTVRPGEVVALLGANGAGKTTTLLTISRIVKPMGGRVLYCGDDCRGNSPDGRARLGVAHVPEGRGVFFGLTVAEHFKLAHRGETLDTAAAFQYFPPLESPTRRRAGPLSGRVRGPPAVAP